MKHCLVAICFSALALSWALAQDVNHAAYVHDNLTAQDSNSDVIPNEVSKVVADPKPVAGRMPATMTVRTTTLLELHAMRESAVDLCLRLPTKYRTHLPECADIFKHEIRLQAIARDKK
ncbi:MAG: hypothetical protein WBW53_15010 [Terriglobales bacterium]